MTNLDTTKSEDRKSNATSKMILYLWAQLPLAGVGALIALGLLVWIYTSVQGTNRDATELDNTIYSSISSISIVVEKVENDFHMVYEGAGVTCDLTNPVELLREEISTLQSIVQTDDSPLGDVPEINISELARLREASIDWYEENDSLNTEHRESWSATQRAISHLRQQMDSMLGRRRIQSILIANKLRESEAENQDQLVDAFLDESKLGSMLSMSNAGLSDLEIICSRLVSLTEIDMLESVLQNEIVPSIDRLDQQIDELGSPEMQDSFILVKESIFGVYSESEEEPGLYSRTQARLSSHEAGEHLRSYVQQALLGMRALSEYQAESAMKLQTHVADMTSKSLQTGGITMILSGLLIGGVYGLLVFKITHIVQSFVKDLHKSHEALEVANTETIRAHHELQESVHEREQLQNQLLEAQKLESIGQLAAGIAHEINTPAQYVGDNTRFLKNEFDSLLKVVDQYAMQLDKSGPNLSWEERCVQIKETLEELDYEFLREEIPSSITQSIEGIDRIVHIVKAMKDFSHPGSTQKEYADINNAIKSTTVVCSNRWKYTADIEFDLEESLENVPCMINEFNQVVLNLVVNAADAIQSFRGDSGSKGLIRIATCSKEDGVQISVEDNGGGMPESVRDKIFDPFYTTKEVGKGTGQGLAISRDVIVNKHSGSLKCETEDGVGTTFYIYLPNKFVDDAVGGEQVAA